MSTKTEGRGDKLRATHEKLQQAVAEIASGDDWKRMLQVTSKFHRYSFANQMLIFAQKTEATLVAGFNKWKSMGRYVCKGEKGLAIFAPCRYRTKIEADDGDEKTLQEIRGFRVVHVWDVAQTEGEPIPDLDAVRPRLLTEDVPQQIWNALVAQANAVGFQVVHNRKRSENGYCDFLSKEIGIRPDVEPAQAVKTLVHELAHALLHGDDVARPREIEEVEVESVTYVVCDALGLDTSDYSFVYVARWSEGLMELVKDTAERVTNCARSVLEVVEGYTQNELTVENVS